MMKTRFAPSPSGALHLGGARTALFNYLFARHHQGEFLLRIEDTDKARSTQTALNSILDGLNWLGLNWDGEPIYQSRRAPRHQEIARHLVQQGRAYHCICSPEKLAQARQDAISQKRPVRYDRSCRNANHAAGAIRIKAPLDGATSIQDAIQGDITIQNNQLDDFIILRQDGSPTYMLCVVVDDHDMDISHIIRGSDHLTNAARQSVIYRAMGWNLPAFAHIPLIHGADGAKLSKRHGAEDVNSYRQQGYLPEAMRNYLSRLGWAHGDDEIFSTEQAVRWFSLEAIGKSPARFDAAKLDSLNGYYLRHKSDQELLALFYDALNLDKNVNYQRFIPVLRLIAERSKRLTEFAQNASFLIKVQPLKTLNAEEKALIAELAPKLERAPWEKTALERVVKTFADQRGGLKITAQAMRIALIGQKNAPSIFEVMSALGQKETLIRIKNALNRETS